ncbi:MAG: M28 family peptidase, partial [Gemmatimonadaceae bacterium]
MAAPTTMSEGKPPALLDAALVNAYAEEVSGDLAFDHVAVLSTMHRLTATAAFDSAAAYVASNARASGLKVDVHDYPADGKTEFWTWLTFPRWEATAGDLSWVEPGKGLITSFTKTPVSLAEYSSSADVATEVVDVGTGNRDSDYTGKDVRGKLVFTTGFPSMVYQRAVVQRGAVGIITWYTELTQLDAAAWLSIPIARGDVPPLPKTFAFVLSYFQGRTIKRALDSGKPVRLHARVAASTSAGHYRVVSATIAGTDPKAREVWFSAHLDHQKPGANDNASGSAVLLE